MTQASLAGSVNQGTAFGHAHTFQRRYSICHSNLKNTAVGSGGSNQLPWSNVHRRRSESFSCRRPFLLGCAAGSSGNDARESTVDGLAEFRSPQYPRSSVPHYRVRDFLDTRSPTLAAAEA